MEGEGLIIRMAGVKPFNKQLATPLETFPSPALPAPTDLGIIPLGAGRLWRAPTALFLPSKPPTSTGDFLNGFINRYKELLDLSG